MDMEEYQDHQVEETDPRRKEEVAAAKIGEQLSISSCKKKKFITYGVSQKIYLRLSIELVNRFGVRFGDCVVWCSISKLIIHLSKRCVFTYLRIRI